ncbi:MAG: tRNA pseudouridine(54/55) synthase Pus10 [Candidatus Micrarchaeota archaeon]
MIKLCIYCKKRNLSKFKKCANEQCFICKGASARLNKMLKNLSLPKEWKSFAISTEIPREIMAREEEVWDFGIAESIKNDFNKKIVSALVKKGVEYNVFKNDGKITFDFIKNSVYFSNSDIFIFGKYKKFCTNLAQSEWTCKSCNGKGCEKCGFAGIKYNSIEAIIGKEAREIYGAKDAELHCSGREDIDVLNVAGRAFVLELRAPTKNKLDLKILLNRVNKSKKVKISDLKYVSNSEVALVSDSHFDKAYQAEIGIRLSSTDKKKILSFGGKTIYQQTPERVLHRRSNLIRKRKILDLQIIGSSKIYIVAEAGTYIKEFINGDNGRTKPNIAEKLGKKVKCLNLSVVKIYDEFLQDIQNQ